MSYILFSQAFAQTLHVYKGKYCLIYVVCSMDKMWPILVYICNNESHIASTLKKKKKGYELSTSIIWLMELCKTEWVLIEYIIIVPKEAKYVTFSGSPVFKSWPFGSNCEIIHSRILLIHDNYLDPSRITWFYNLASRWNMMTELQRCTL